MVIIALCFFVNLLNVSPSYDIVFHWLQAQKLTFFPGVHLDLECHATPRYLQIWWFKTSCSFFQWICLKTSVPKSDAFHHISSCSLAKSAGIPVADRMVIAAGKLGDLPIPPAELRTADPFGVCEGSPPERELASGSPAGTLRDAVAQCCSAP